MPATFRTASIWRTSTRSSARPTTTGNIASVDSHGGMQCPMPDATHDLVFWKDLAAKFSADQGVLFELYSEQILAPSLQAGHIVVLDNLNTYTGEKVRRAIEARGCQLLFLPSYSSDLSPIEEAFSKLKAFLRRVGARAPEALQEMIGQALQTITVQDAHGWFRHCGYLSLEEKAS